MGSWERDRRALGSASTPAAPESTVLADISTDLAERMLGEHHGAWHVAGFDNTMTAMLPSSAETHRSGEPSQFSLGTRWMFFRGETGHQLSLAPLALLERIVHWVRPSILTMCSGQFSGLLQA